MGAKKFNERRKAQRLEIPLAVKYKILPHKRIVLGAVTQDVSGGGVSLKSNVPFKKGQQLKVLVYLPGDPKPVTSMSEVVWSRKAGEGKEAYYKIGVKFMKIVPKDKQRFVFLFCEMMINYMTLGRIK